MRMKKKRDAYGTAASIGKDSVSIFQSGQTKSYAHRIAALNKIEAWIPLKHEAMIQDAFISGFAKSTERSIYSEIGMTLE